MKQIIIKRRMHVPRLHLLHHPVPELLSRQHHKFISKAFTGCPFPVIYEKTRCLIGGIVGIQFILMESGLAASIIKQHNDLQTQKQYHSYEKNLFILFLHASSPLESCFSVMPNAPCVPALVPFRAKEDRFYSSLSGRDSS